MKFTKAREKSIREVVNAFNKKVRYVEKIGNPDSVAALPQKVKINDLKSMDRDLLNQELRFMRSFANQRGITVEEIGNKKITDIEKRYIERALSKTNSNRAKRRKELNIDTNNIGQMPQARELNLLPKKLPQKMRSKNDITRLRRSLQQQSNYDYFREVSEQYVINLMKAAKKETGKYGDFISSIIKRISRDELYRRYIMHMDATFEYKYGANPDADKAHNIITEFLNEGDIKSPSNPEANESEWDLSENEKYEYKTAMNILDNSFIEEDIIDPYDE